MKTTTRTISLLTLLLLTLPGGLRPTPAQGAVVQEAREEDEDEREEGLPMEPARSVSIDADRGTWISLDVSPDGRTLVFDYLGDLYTLPVEGGEATRITSGLAFDAQPRFSPDGERIVFTSDRSGGQNIWIMSLDGSDTVQVSRGKANRAESPEWTPDGEYVVASMGDFRGGDLPRLHLFHAEGGRGTRLVDEPERLKTLGAAFGDDGRHVWFAQRRGDWEYNADLPQYQLAVYDRETGERYTRSSRYGSAFRPTLSPDGRWLVYGTRHDEHTGLRIRDLRDGSERWLAYPVQHDDQESRATLDVLPGMTFTPDSNHLIASYGGRIWKLPTEGGEAQEIPFRVRADVAMGPEVEFDYEISDSPTFVVRQIRNAVPSPDGSRLAFTAMDHLYVSEADGSNHRRATALDVSEHHPVWSPDGRSLAFVSWSTEGGGHILRVPVDGSASPEQLTRTPAVYTAPAWSPDGERIVAFRGWAREFRQSSSPFAVGAADELVWVPADGGEATVIGQSEDREAPHFTDDPDRIYVYDDEEGLISMRWDGTDEKAHLKVTGSTPPGAEDPSDPDVILMAPRGDLALASIDRQLYTVTVPRVGGEAPTVSVSNPERAEFPARKVTDAMGGEFPAWGADGRTVHWSLGNAHFVHDVARARAVDDSVESVRRERGEEQDENEAAEDAGYEPREFRVRLQAQRDMPSGVVALQGARIVTMRGDEIMEDGTIVIRNNRIAAVGPRDEVEIPDDARVFAVEGKTIIPGLVDTHAHMWPTWGVHRKDQWIYLANLAYGVTTTRDPQTSTTDVLSYADLVRAGEIPGPRVYSTGPGVFWQEEVEDLDHAREMLRRYKEYFDTRTIKMYVAGNRQQRQWILMAARELGLMPTTEGSLNIKQNISETLDGYPGLEHSLPIYPVYDDVAQLFATSKRAYTPTLLVAYGGPWAENYFFETEDVHGNGKLRRYTPHEEIDEMTRRRGQWFLEEEHVFQDHARFVADLVEAGGRAGVGSHGQLQGLGYHWELWAMQSGGLNEHDALKVATRQGAEALGLDQEIGTLEEGKLADLVVLNENPLRNIRATNEILYVMKNGRLYQGDTLQEVWPRHRSIEPLWWWNAEPGNLPGVSSN